MNVSSPPERKRDPLNVPVLVKKSLSLPNSIGSDLRPDFPPVMGRVPAGFEPLPNAGPSGAGISSCFSSGRAVCR